VLKDIVRLQFDAEVRFCGHEFYAADPGELEEGDRSKRGPVALKRLLDVELLQVDRQLHRADAGVQPFRWDGDDDAVDRKREGILELDIAWVGRHGAADRDVDAAASRQAVDRAADIVAAERMVSSRTADCAASRIAADDACHRRRRRNRVGVGNAARAVRAGIIRTVVDDMERRAHRMSDGVIRQRTAAGWIGLIGHDDVGNRRAAGGALRGVSRGDVGGRAASRRASVVLRVNDHERHLRIVVRIRVAGKREAIDLLDRREVAGVAAARVAGIRREPRIWRASGQGVGAGRREYGNAAGAARLIERLALFTDEQAGRVTIRGCGLDRERQRLVGEHVTDMTIRDRVARDLGVADEIVRRAVGSAANKAAGLAGGYLADTGYFVAQDVCSARSRRSARRKGGKDYLAERLGGEGGHHGETEAG